MKWFIDDEGRYDLANIREGNPRGRIVCTVLSPAGAFMTPSDDGRAQMLQTAREIVDAHNAKETT